MLPPNAGRIWNSRFLCNCAVGCFVVADLQIGAVGGQSRLGRAGDSRGQVPAGRRRAVKHDLRLVFVNQVVDYFGVAVRLVMLQAADAPPDKPCRPRIESALSQALLRCRPAAPPQVQRREYPPDAALAHQLKRRIFQQAAMLFREYPNFTLSIYVYHFSYLVVRFSCSFSIIVNFAASGKVARIVAFNFSSTS